MNNETVCVVIVLILNFYESEMELCISTLNLWWDAILINFKKLIRLKNKNIMIKSWTSKLIENYY